MVGTVARPKDRKAAIAAAAAELFAVRGFAAVGIDDIGAAVGVSGPALYRHFAGKDAVLASVVLDAATMVTDAVEQADGIEEAVRASVRAALDRPAPLATYLRERARVTGEDERVVRGLERRAAAAWRSALQGARPELAADAVRLRQAAVVGGLSAATSRPTTVARPRLDELLAAAALAVFAAPVQPPNAASDAASDWQPAPTKRDEIVATALRLFAERGFHGVGMDEIGAAAGISGPTVYHYVASKAEILIDGFERSGQRVAAGVDEAVAAASSAADALVRLARSYAEVAIDTADLIVVTSREGVAVPDEERPRLVRRRQAIQGAWGKVLQELRPDLGEAEARLLVRSAFPLVNHAAVTVRGRREMAHEVAGLAVAWLSLTSV